MREQREQKHIEMFKITPGAYPGVLTPTSSKSAVRSPPSSVRFLNAYLHAFISGVWVCGVGSWRLGLIPLDSLLWCR